MKTLRVGIASYEAMKARTMTICSGKRCVLAGEPTVWFTSTESVARHFLLGRSRWSLVGGLRLTAGEARSARGLSKLPPAAQ